MSGVCRFASYLMIEGCYRMSNYIVFNDSVIREDWLKHHKYIDRKRVNGKWRYVYDADERDLKKGRQLTSGPREVTQTRQLKDTEVGKSQRKQLTSGSREVTQTRQLGNTGKQFTNTGTAQLVSLGSERASAALAKLQQKKTTQRSRKRGRATVLKMLKK